jgi:hypothetical protein
MGCDVQWTGEITVVAKKGISKTVVRNMLENTIQSGYYISMKQYETTSDYDGSKEFEVTISTTISGREYVVLYVPNGDKMYVERVGDAFKHFVKEFHMPDYTVSGVLCWEDEYHNKGFVSVVDQDVLSGEFKIDWKSQAQKFHLARFRNILKKQHKRNVWRPRRRVNKF